MLDIENGLDWETPCGSSILCATNAPLLTTGNRTN